MMIKTLKKGLIDIGLVNIDVRRLETYYEKCELHSSSQIKQKIIDKIKDKIR